MDYCPNCGSKEFESHTGGWTCHNCGYALPCNWKDDEFDYKKRFSHLSPSTYIITSNEIVLVNGEKI